MENPSTHGPIENAVKRHTRVEVSGQQGSPGKPITLHERRRMVWKPSPILRSE